MAASPWTITEIAAFFGLDRRTVYSWTYRYSDFPRPTIRLGPWKGYDRAEVKRWVRAMKKASRNGFAEEQVAG